MKRNRHPGDLPVVRHTTLAPGEATVIYRLGFRAGERNAARHGGLERSEYWQVYSDVMADLAGIEEDEADR